MSAPDAPLYAWLLGPRYAVLPAIVQQMHDVRDRVTAEGVGAVIHGTSWLARLMVRLLGMPRAGDERRLRVSFTRAGATEVLARHYDDASLATHQRAAGPPGSGLLGERFGPLTLILRLDASPTALDFVLVGARWLGLPAPRVLWPHLAVREFVADGWYRFDVRIGLPLVGPLIHYAGRLKIIAAEPRGLGRDGDG